MQLNVHPGVPCWHYPNILPAWRKKADKNAEPLQAEPVNFADGDSIF